MNSEEIKKLYKNDTTESSLSNRDYDYLFSRITALETAVRDLVLKTAKISAIEQRLNRLERRK